MRTFGFLFVLAIFAFAITVIAYHFFPSVANTAFRLPTYDSKAGWVANSGWAITGTTIIFGIATVAGYKLVKK